MDCPERIRHAVAGGAENRNSQQGLLCLWTIMPVRVEDSFPKSNEHRVSKSKSIFFISLHRACFDFNRRTRQLFRRPGRFNHRWRCRFGLGNFRWTWIDMGRSALAELTATMASHRRLYCNDTLRRLALCHAAVCRIANTGKYSGANATAV